MSCPRSSWWSCSTRTMSTAPPRTRARTRARSSPVSSPRSIHSSTSRGARARRWRSRRRRATAGHDRSRCGAGGAARARPAGPVRSVVLAGPAPPRPASPRLASPMRSHTGVTRTLAVSEARSQKRCLRSGVSEVDRAPRTRLDHVEVVRPRAGGEVLPAGVGDDEHDHAFVDLARALRRAGSRRAPRDAGEDARLGEAAGPLDRLPRTHDQSAVQQVPPAAFLEHRWHEALVEVLQAVDHLARRRLDGPDLHVGVLLAEERAAADDRPRRAETAHEVRDLRAVAPDLRTGALVVGLGVGGV